MVARIREQNVQVAAGAVWAASPRRPELQLTAGQRAGAARSTEEEFGDIIVKTGADGAAHPPTDVARIELGAGTYSLAAALNNKPAVGDRDLPGAGLERARSSPATGARKRWRS